MRIYQPFFFQKNISLNQRNRHHVINVMRCREGDFCTIFDGLGHEVKAQIKIITKKEVILDVLELIHNNRESSLNIHLFQALCKSEKMDWIIQKSVELGVTEITPVITERCDVKISLERLEKKVEHWMNIMISATEQSGRAVLPTLNFPSPFYKNIDSDRLNLFFTPHTEQTLSTIPQPSQDKRINIFIGPEGGFSESEEVFARDKNIHRVSLGKRILRTETAPLAIISVLQALWGDFLPQK